jgi:probable rRNA maturation factor
LVRKAIHATLREEGIPDGRISLAFLRDPEILELNRRWLDHDWVPDVLSFALHTEGDPPVGDIYVGVEQAQRHATQLAVALDEEIVRLVVHGVLHVLGYEHPDSPSARRRSRMFRKQEALVRQLIGERETEAGSEEGPGVRGSTTRGDGR